MYKKFIYLLLLLDLSFFYIIPINELSRGAISNYQKIGVVIVGIIATLIYFKRLFKEKRYLFYNNLLFLGCLFICEIFLSALMYAQGIRPLITVSNHYIIVIAYFIICYYMDKNNGIAKLEKIILNFSIILSVVLIIQYIVYNLNGELFLYIDRERAASSIRFGTIRIYESAYLPAFASVLSFGIFLKRDKVNMKILSGIAFSISFLQVILVSKNRMSLLMMTLSYIYMIFIKYDKKRIRKWVSLLSSFILIVFLLQLPSINNFISTFSLKEASITIREQAINYYVQQLSEHPIFGVGFIEPIENDKSFYEVRGNDGIFYKDDIGILGSIHTFGLFFIIWYIFLIFKIVKVLRVIRKEKKQTQYIELYGLYCFSIIGSIVMNPFDSQRIVLFPFVLAFIDYANKTVLREKGFNLDNKINQERSKYEIYN